MKPLYKIKYNKYNMLNKLNNVQPVRKIGGSLAIILTDYLKDLGVGENDFVVINSESQIRAFSEVKIITIEKHRVKKQ